jgi:hypothetical protein
MFSDGPGHCWSIGSVRNVLMACGIRASAGNVNEGSPRQRKAVIKGQFPGEEESEMTDEWSELSCAIDDCERDVPGNSRCICRPGSESVKVGKIGNTGLLERFLYWNRRVECRNIGVLNGLEPSLMV